MNEWGGSFDVPSDSESSTATTTAANITTSSSWAHDVGGNGGNGGGRRGTQGGFVRAGNMGGGAGNGGQQQEGGAHGSNFGCSFSSYAGSGCCGNTGDNSPLSCQTPVPGGSHAPGSIAEPRRAQSKKQVYSCMSFPFLRFYITCFSFSFALFLMLSLF